MRMFGQMAGFGGGRASIWRVSLLLLIALGFLPSAQGQDSPLGKGKVSRSAFTSDVVNREPVDDIVLLDNGATSIYFFTELKFLQGRTIVHRWEYNGKVQAEVSFKVGGPRWRVYSKKTLYPSQQGEWTVIVKDQETGWPLEARMFRFKLPDEERP